MITLETPKLIGYPPAPTNGGPLDYALDKIGDWAWQPKVDDRRVAIHAPTRTVYNQYGELSIADRQPEKFKAALDWLSMAYFKGYEWLDCGLMEYRHDMMRGCIIVFDIMTADGEKFNYRRAVLEDALEEMPLASDLSLPCRDRVFLVQQWTCSAKPIGLWRILQNENATIGRKFYEGLVAKRMDTIYPLEQRAKQKTPMWVKHRFDQ